MGVRFASASHVSKLVLLLLAGLIFTVSASADTPPGNQNNNVEVQCTSAGSSATFYLCQDGNSCGRIATDGPAPYKSANSGQDNVDFTGLAIGETATVNYQLIRDDVPEFTYEQGGNTVTFNDVQSNPARGSIIDTSNNSTSFSVSNSSAAGPFSITKTSSVNSTRHNINLLQPSQYDNPKPQYNFLKYTVTCTKTQATGKIIFIKNNIGGNSGDKFTLQAQLTPNAPVSVTVTTSSSIENGFGGIAEAGPIAVGNYTVTETGYPDGTTKDDWQTSISCVGNNSTGATAIVSTAGDVTCTVTNTRKTDVRTIPLNIHKELPLGGQGTFSFQLKNGDEELRSGSLSGAGSLLSFASVAVGTAYTLQETISDTSDAFSTEGSCAGASVSFSPNTRTITLTPNSVDEQVDCTFENKRIEGQRATISVKKRVVGGPGGTFSFNSSIGDLNKAGLNVSAGSIVPVSSAVLGAFGPITITETINAGPYELTSASCEVDGGGTPKNGAGSLSNGTLTVTPAPNEDLVCTFVNTERKDNRASEETKRFVNRRLDNLLTYGPDRARMLRRLGEAPPEQQSLKDGPMKLNGAAPAAAASAPVSRSMSTSAAPDLFGSRAPTGSMALGANPFSTAAQQNDAADPSRPDLQLQSGPTSTATGILANLASQLMPAMQDSGTIKFSTSLSELRSVATAAEQQRQNDLMMKAGLNFADTPFVMQPDSLRPGFDVWVEGTIVRYNDDLGGVNRDGDFSVLYVGADYVVSPDFLIGALVQVDDTDEDIDDPSLQGNIDGRGWMAGPYIGIRLADNLYFDARAAWGQSDNDLDLTDASLGQRTGSFETDRWLASATLTGNEYYGAWRFTPQVGIAYGEEDYGSYTTSLAQTIPGDGASIGRVTGTMEVGYRFNGYDGSIIEPHVAISGIWNFDSDDLYVNGILAEPDESRARVEGGLLITTPSGIGLRGAAGYDGIGAEDFEAVSGSLWINVPLH